MFVRTKPILFVALVLGLGVALTGCGFTSLSVTLSPTPIVVTKDTTTVDVVVSLHFKGTGWVTVDDIILALKDSWGDIAVDPSTGEELVYVEKVRKSISAAGQSITFKIPVDLTYDMVSNLNISKLELSVTGSRPVTASTNIFHVPETDAGEEGHS